VKHAITAEVREYDRLFGHEAPDADKEKDFMEFLNPDSLKIKTGYLEPGLASAKPGERFQFQRIGYFVVDSDSKPNNLVFNKTVGLRDSWAKQSKPSNKPKSTTQNNPQQKRSALSVIQQLGKKYTNLPLEKQEKAKAEIKHLAQDVSYEELEPLFGTSVKKTGTRIAVMITLKELLKNGLKPNEQIEDFIKNALNDENQLLAEEARSI
jgi:glutaminyl-tRNA synthetase